MAKRSHWIRRPVKSLQSLGCMDGKNHRCAAARSRAQPFAPGLPPQPAAVFAATHPERRGWGVLEHQFAQAAVIVAGNCIDNRWVDIDAGGDAAAGEEPSVKNDAGGVWDGVKGRHMVRHRPIGGGAGAFQQAGGPEVQRAGANADDPLRARRPLRTKASVGAWRIASRVGPPAPPITRMSELGQALSEDLVTTEGRSEPLITGGAVSQTGCSQAPGRAMNACDGPARSITQPLARTFSWSFIRPRGFPVDRGLFAVRPLPVDFD